MEFDEFTFFEDFLDHMSSLFDELEAKKENEKKYEESIASLNYELKAMNSKGEYDLCARDYVTILELIRNIVTYISSNSVLSDNLKEKIYGKILEEIEPALDDLTLDSLLLVIIQFKTLNEYIKEYNNHLADERKAKKVLRPINEEMRKKDKIFKKIIKRGN